MTTFKNLIRSIIGRFVPFSSLIMSSQSNNEVEIKIFEKFNNKDFGLETIEFLMSNQQIFIKKALLRARTSLFGLRYFMQEWFWTCMLLTVSTMSTLVCTGLLLGLVMIKRAGWL